MHRKTYDNNDGDLTSSSPWAVLYGIYILQNAHLGIYSLSGQMYYMQDLVKPRSRDSGLDFSNRSEIWQAHRQPRCRDARQILERYHHYNMQIRGLAISRDLR